MRRISSLSLACRRQTLTAYHYLPAQLFARLTPVRPPGRHHWIIWSALAAVLSHSCGSPRNDPPNNPRETDAGAIDVPPVSLSITFSPSEPQLAPGDTQRIRVTTEPAGEFSLQLSLPVNEVSGFLDRGRLTTNSKGEGSFAITVARDGKLTIRVSHAGSSSLLPLEVKERPVGTLLVQPLYDGARAVDEWIVSTRLTAECSDLGAYELGQTFARDAPIRIDNVRAGSPIKLLMRGKHYVYGCREVSLVPGVDNAFELTLSDRPLQLAGLDTELALGFERTTQLSEHLEDTITAMLSPFFRHQNDAGALLEAMARRASEERDFDLAADRYDWQQEAEAHFNDLGQSPTLLRERADALLRQGSELLFQANVISSHLSGSDRLGSGSFQASTVAGVEASAYSVVAAMSAASLDATAPEGMKTGEYWVRASFQFAWEPATLLGGLAANKLGDPVSAGLRPALSEAVDCQALAARLHDAQARVDTDGTFTASALTALCDSGVELLWADALGAPNNRAVLNVGAAGAAAPVSEVAIPLGFSGDWAGSLYVVPRDVEPTANEPSLPVRGQFNASQAE